MYLKSNNTRQKVRNLIREYPETRHDNNLLLSIFWEKEGVQQIDDIVNATPAAAIIRARQYVIKE